MRGREVPATYLTLGQAELDLSQFISVIGAGHLGNSSSTTHLSCTQRTEQPSPSKQTLHFLWVHSPGHGSTHPGDSVTNTTQKPLGHSCCAPHSSWAQHSPPLLQKGFPWAPSKLRDTLLFSTQPGEGTHLQTPLGTCKAQVTLGWPTEERSEAVEMNLKEATKLV